MRRVFYYIEVLCVVVIIAACHTTATIVDSAQGVVEYHQSRYLRLCDGGMSTTPECMDYGFAINNLIDVISDIDNKSDSSFVGKLPRTAKQDLDDAKARVAVTSRKVK